MPRPLPNFISDLSRLDRLRPFSRIRLIALDLDGTLLDSSESDIPIKIGRLCRRLSAHAFGSIRITVASGRTIHGVKSLIGDIQIKRDTPIILYNGSVIAYFNKEAIHIISRKVVSYSTLSQIISKLVRHQVKVLAYTCETYGQLLLNEKVYGWSTLDKPFVEHNGMIVQWLNWHDEFKSIEPSSIIVHASDQKHIQKIKFELSKIEGITCIRGGRYVEIRPKGSDKGNALAYAARELDLSSNEVLAIGDNDNDVEMLSWAGISVAVGSASLLAIQNSQYRASKNVYEGAIEVLNLLSEAIRLFK